MSQENVSLAERLQSVWALYQSSSRSLLDLAKQTRYDIFEFYNHADLSGLDLSGQNLKGLNFEGANLRASKLDNVLFDPGAFNSSFVDDVYSSVKDEFDIYIRDILAEQIQDLVVYVRFRERVIDHVLERYAISFQKFGDMSNVSTPTLRKARRSEPVSLETTRGISQAMLEVTKQLPFPGSSWDSRLLRQPCFQTLETLKNGGFAVISREQLMQALEMSRFVNLRRYGTDTVPDRRSFWRSTPATLIWVKDYYERADFRSLDSTVVGPDHKNHIE